MLGLAEPMMASNCGAYVAQQLAICPGILIKFSALAFKLGYSMFRKAAPGEDWCGFRTKRWEGLLSERFKEKTSRSERSGVTMGATKI